MKNKEIYRETDRESVRERVELDNSLLLKTLAVSALKGIKCNQFHQTIEAKDLFLLIYGFPMYIQYSI